MGKYKVDKLIETLLTNNMIHKNPIYTVTEIGYLTSNTYKVIGLKAETDNGSIWFSYDRLSCLIEDIADIIVTEQCMKIIFTNWDCVVIELDK